MRYLTFLMLLLVLSCQNESSIESPFTDTKQELDTYIFDKIKNNNEPFDWNEESNDLIFKALKLSDNKLVVGFSDGVNINKNVGLEIVSKISKLQENIEEGGLKYFDDELGFFVTQVSDVSVLSEIRRMKGVTFIQPNEYVPDLKFFGASSGVQNSTSASKRSSNKIIDPYDETIPYADQIFNYKPSLHEVALRHNVDKIYQKYKNYGEGRGIGVIDNGIVPDYYDLYLSNGYGERQVGGFYTPFWFLPNAQPDGFQPLDTDILGIAKLFEGQWLHGTGMMESALIMAPNSDYLVVRSSFAILLLFADQIVATAKAISSMADNPMIHISNMSMGMIFVDNRIGNAVRKYDSKGKILCCAGGTSFKEIKKSLGVIYPANMKETIAVTGVDNREFTNGEYIAGETAHSGRRIDFCTERSAASSEATARFVGMLSLVWSANPSLTPEQVKEICIQSSDFYQNNNGQKDLKFGWGVVDFFQAYEMALTY